MRASDCLDFSLDSLNVEAEANFRAGSQGLRPRECHAMAKRYYMFEFVLAGPLNFLNKTCASAPSRKGAAAACVNFRVWWRSHTNDEPMDLKLPANNLPSLPNKFIAT